ncbi:MAG: hypothetical protein IKO41_05410 [Lachnospiraceae bacterium]|nr:hypothetical protein [Lachnospiraceae bacterium]
MKNGDSHNNFEANRVFPGEYSSMDEWRSDHGRPSGFGGGLFDWWILVFVIIGVLDIIAKIL